MTTIPARLAKAVHIATTQAEARQLSINAYRAWYRSAPEICALYALDVSPSAIRLKIRQDFEKNRAITDLGIINMLLHKNQQEYQETMNCWKQEVSGGCTMAPCYDQASNTSHTSCTGSRSTRIPHLQRHSWTSSCPAATRPKQSIRFKIAMHRYQIAFV